MEHVTEMLVPTLGICLKNRIPSMPFESVCMDFFELEGWQYLVMVDRFSGWCEVKRAKSGMESTGSKGLITAMRQLFDVFGVPCEISSDGAPEFVAAETTDFYNRWGIDYQQSSAHHPVSNGHAELGVKSMKQLLHDNVGPGGSLDNDRSLRAILAHRNSPDQLSEKSPAEILFGHQLSKEPKLSLRMRKCCHCGERRGHRRRKQ